MKRSYTVDFAAAQADDSNESLATTKKSDHGDHDRTCSPCQQSPESPTVMHEIDEADVPVRRPSNHLVTAIIESASISSSARSTTNPMMQPRECVTPPPNLSIQSTCKLYTYVHNMLVHMY